jgi:8-oxo-dGTP pyrophosphatase MutT (NUDIX family)
MKITNFNLRVYGLLIIDGRVLITHENRGGTSMSKFPGGGLEKGEGLADCLIREFGEELNINITVGDLFYTNEFLQVSAFNPSDQLHSFYYFVHTSDVISESYFREGTVPGVGEQIFEWLKLSEILPERDLTFPIDRIVAGKLVSK